jgi:hypothetical protein
MASQERQNGAGGATKVAKHTRPRVSSSSDTSSTGALSTPSSSPFVFVSGAGGFCVLEVVLSVLVPPTVLFLLAFFFLFPFFLLLAGPGYREASLPISENAHSEEAKGGDVAWSGLCTSGVHAPQAHSATYLGLLIGWDPLARPKTTWFGCNWRCGCQCRGW